MSFTLQVAKTINIPGSLSMTGNLAEAVMAEQTLAYVELPHKAWTTFEEDSGADSDDETAPGMITEDASSDVSSKLRSPSPESLTIQADSATQATSTLTEDSSADIATSLEQMMLQNPALAQQLWLKTSAHLHSNSMTVSPNEGVDGN